MQLKRRDQYLSDNRETNDKQNPLYSLTTMNIIFHDIMMFLQIVELDLSTVTPSLSGPKRPHDRVAVSDMKQDFMDCLNNKVGFKGFGIPADKQSLEVPFTFEGQEYKLSHGENFM